MRMPHVMTISRLKGTEADVKITGVPCRVQDNDRDEKHPLHMAFRISTKVPATSFQEGDLITAEYEGLIRSGIVSRLRPVSLGPIKTVLRGSWLLTNLGLDFPHVVEIIGGTPVEDAGGSDIDWSNPATVDTVRASLTPVSAEERLRAASVGLEITHEVLMPYTAEATAERRLRMDTRMFDITERIDAEERGLLTRLLVREQTGG